MFILYVSVFSYLFSAEQCVFTTWNAGLVKHSFYHNLPYFPLFPRDNLDPCFPNYSDEFHPVLFVTWWLSFFFRTLQHLSFIWIFFCGLRFSRGSVPSWHLMFPNLIANPHRSQMFLNSHINLLISVRCFIISSSFECIISLWNYRFLPWFDRWFEYLMHFNDSIPFESFWIHSSVP